MQLKKAAWIIKGVEPLITSHSPIGLPMGRNEGMWGFYIVQQQHMRMPVLCSLNNRGCEVDWKNSGGLFVLLAPKPKISRSGQEGAWNSFRRRSCVFHAYARSPTVPTRTGTRAPLQLRLSSFPHRFQAINDFFDPVSGPSGHLLTIKTYFGPKSHAGP